MTSQEVGAGSKVKSSLGILAVKRKQTDAPARIYDCQRIPLQPPIGATLGAGACAALPADAADLYHHRHRHGGGGAADLTRAALLVVAAYLGYGACDIVNSLVLRVLGQRVERDTRAELYLSLLGKSQTFLNRQSVGDLMARATYDVQQVSLMVAPNSGLIIESFFALVVPIVTIAALRVDLLLVPLLFLLTFSIAIQRY